MYNFSFVSFTFFLIEYVCQMIGISLSDRGAGMNFGQDITKHFMDNNSLSMNIRSHECVFTGFHKPYNNNEDIIFHNSMTTIEAIDSNANKNGPLLCTLFSASNYCHGDNYGAYLEILTELPRRVSIKDLKDTNDTKDITKDNKNNGISDSKRLINEIKSDLIDIEDEIHTIPSEDESIHPNIPLYYIVKQYKTTKSDQMINERNKTSLASLILRKKGVLLKEFESIDEKDTENITRYDW